MITKTDLAVLNEYKAAAGRVLSVYLDVDQSNASNLNREFEAAFEAKIKETGGVLAAGDEREDFARCVAEARKVITAYEPRARGIVMFMRSPGSTWMRELNVPVSTEVHWASAAHVKQFVEALDEFETYGVVLTDRSQSRIFTVNLGTMEKHAEIHAMNGTRRIKTTGTDHLYSQSHIQHKADEHVLSHLKRVVEVLEHLSRANRFGRLVLAGVNETTSELFRLLPKALRRKVVASMVIAANASENQVLAEVSLIARKAERDHEIEKVEMLITAAAKGHNAVTELNRTLEALNGKRVRELVYPEGSRARGSICDKCGAAFPNETIHCDFCGLPLEPAGDLIEAAIGLALSESATIQQVRGEAAKKLEAAGGIGAFLRY